MPVPTRLSASMLISSRAVLLFVSSVVQRSIVSEITYVVVLIVSIVMTHFHTIRARTYKRLSHRHGYVHSLPHSVLVKLSPSVTCTVRMCSFRRGLTRPYAPELTSVTNLVQSFKPFNVSPLNFHAYTLPGTAARGQIPLQNP